MALQKNIYFILVLLIFSLAFYLNTACINESAEDLQKKNDLMALTVPPITCDSGTPFSSLSAAGAASCASGSCHDSISPAAGLNMTDYGSVLARVIPYNPAGSLLYQKVAPGGSMEAASNSTINQAIYCWIAGGANP